MSKKISIILSVIMFILLVVLIVCESRWPEAGSSFLYGLLG
ncbi:MAG: hypothetical protein ACI39Q_01240 [Wujia sp.]